MLYRIKGMFKGSIKEGLFIGTKHLRTQDIENTIAEVLEALDSRRYRVVYFNNPGEIYLPMARFIHEEEAGSAWQIYCENEPLGFVSAVWLSVDSPPTKGELLCYADILASDDYPELRKAKERLQTNLRLTLLWASEDGGEEEPCFTE